MKILVWLSQQNQIPRYREFLPYVYSTMLVAACFLLAGGHNTINIGEAIGALGAGSP